MYFSGRDFFKGVIVFATICAVAGWAVIELAIWLLGNISVGWGGQ
jgi:uncharacterized RDD family membrane protein YckC